MSGTLGGNTKTYLSSLSYAPHGGPLAHTFGNSLTRTYDYNNRLQPRELVDRLPSVTNPILDLQYFYGSSTTDLYAGSAQNNGNPRQIKIGAQEPAGGASYGFTHTYGFGTLNRVTSMSDNGGAAENFGYDRYGNVWLSAAPTGVPGQTQMAAAQSDYDQANNRRSGGSYDGYGNQTVLGASTLGYDAENRFDSVTANTTTYKYDGLGQRVSKQTGSGTPTQYVRDAFGNLAAEYGPSDAASCTACYLSTDHLGVRGW